MVQNKALVFKKVPTELPKVGEHLVVEDVGIDLDAKLNEDEILLKTLYVSVDPYMRGRLRDPKIKSYSPPFELDKPLTTRVVAKVVKSNNTKFKEGDVVTGLANLAEYSVTNKFIQNIGLEPTRVIKNPHDVKLAHFLSSLGNPGLTAYSSLYEIGKIGNGQKKGKTIFVSAAAGAVGQIVCQISKHEGLKVIGSAGDDRKVDFLKNELGVDAAFNYKKESTDEALKRLAPNGIDLYYENVGGETLEAAITHLNNRGIIMACGMISGYNSKPEDQYGVKNLMQFIAKELTMTGFLSMSYFEQYDAEYQDKLGSWIKDGSFKPELDIAKGIDQSGEAFLGIFESKNLGKSIVQIADE